MPFRISGAGTGFGQSHSSSYASTVGILAIHCGVVFATSSTGASVGIGNSQYGVRSLVDRLTILNGRGIASVSNLKIGNCTIFASASSGPAIGMELSTSRDIRNLILFGNLRLTCETSQIVI
jgi:hypothetical protein